MVKSILTVVAAIAVHQAAGAQFVEKLSLAIPRTAVDSALISAANSRIDEIASDRLQTVFSDASRQAKMSPVAIQQLKSLKSGAFGYTATEQALQLLAWVNSDTLDLSSPTTAPPRSASLGFSPRFNTVRLSWNNLFQDLSCQKTEYFNTPTPTVRNTFFQVKEEAEYKVFRNGKLLTTISGERVTSDNLNFNIRAYKLGPISIRLKGSIPGNPELSSQNSAPLIYDFDPYQGTLGQAVRYRINASFKGCYFPEWLPIATGGVSGSGIGTYTTGEFWLDSDGNSVPDFYPIAPVLEARQSLSRNVEVFNPTETQTIWFWETAHHSVRTTIAGTSPTGTVSYYVNSKLRATRNVIGGVSEVSLDDLKPSSGDTFSVVVLYSGDGRNPPGISREAWVTLYRD